MPNAKDATEIVRGAKFFFQRPSHARRILREMRRWNATVLCSSQAPFEHEKKANASVKPEGCNPPDAKGFALPRAGTNESKPLENKGIPPISRSREATRIHIRDAAARGREAQRIPNSGSGRTGVRPRTSTRIPPPVQQAGTASAGEAEALEKIGGRPPAPRRGAPPRRSGGPALPLRESPASGSSAGSPASWARIGPRPVRGRRAHPSGLLSAPLPASRFPPESCAGGNP